MRNALHKAKAKFKAEGGFTLIELMAVLAILALIAIIAVPAIGSILQKAGDGADESTYAMIEKSAGIAYVADGGTVAGMNATGTAKDGNIANTASATGYTVAYLKDAGFLDYDGDAVADTVVATLDVDTGEFSVPRPSESEGE